MCGPLDFLGLQGMRRVGREFGLSFTLSVCLHDHRREWRPAPRRAVPAETSTETLSLVIIPCD
jgi:hypothetical protein